MVVQEISEKELKVRWNETGSREAVLFYTPLCGTCKLAERMLNIVLEAGETIPVSKINVNYALDLTQDWKISSVPALIIFQAGSLVQKEYAIHSVVELQQWLKL
ncbi:MAG TPA: thioredoxin family protein [Paenibacillus sp.]